MLWLSQTLLSQLPQCHRITTDMMDVEPILMLFSKTMRINTAASNPEFPSRECQVATLPAEVY